MSLFYPRPKNLPALPSRAKSEPKSKSREVCEDSTRAQLTPELLVRLRRNHGHTVKFSLDGDLHFLFSKPEDVHTILTAKSSFFVKGEQEAAIASAIGWGLLTEEGDSHRDQQQKASPAFRATAVDSYVHSVNAVAEESVQDLLNKPGFSLLKVIREFTQEGAERSLFGANDKAMDFRYHQAVQAINELVVWGSTAAQSGPEAVAKIREYRDHRATIRSHVQSLIQDWRGNKRDNPGLIDYLLHEQSETIDSEEILRQRVSLFLQAAVETTAALISWTMVLLSSKPFYWEAIAEESKSLDPAGGMASMSQATMVSAVIRETLRLYPSAWMIPRIAGQPIKIGSTAIPQGARVVLSPWVSHRDPEYFHQPLEFLPERWLDTAFKPTRGSYFPFGMGNRICIGERYGVMTASIFLLAISRADVSVQLNPLDLRPGSTAVIANPSSEISVTLTKKRERSEERV
jgi:cytochrome P450